MIDGSTVTEWTQRERSNLIVNRHPNTLQSLNATMRSMSSWRINAVAIFTAALIGAAALGAYAKGAGAGDSGGFGTRAKAAILVDADTGAILYQSNADEPLPPASITKLMTAEIVLQAIKDGRLKLTDEFTMSVHAWRTGGAPSRTSSMFVPVNTTATVDELLQGMIVQSGNDAAIALAEGMAGTEEAFAKRMNVEAKRLGLTKSTFKNPSGLGAPDHVMTARDIATLAEYLIKEHPTFYPRFGQKEFQYRKFKFRNRNPLLFQDIGVDGLKTGSLSES
jgi:D-alanyl-D-alanine carboxypeptidase (penicillin-binding protein 5/6)